MPIFKTLKMFADSRCADIDKKCRYADIADADINIGTPLKFSFERGNMVYILFGLKCWQCILFKFP